MSVLAGIFEARRALAANRLRTLLTLLGMIIGVAAVVVVVALGQSLQAKVVGDLSAFGADVLWVGAGSRMRGGVRVRSEQALTIQDAAAIAELPTIGGVTPVLWSSAQAVVGNRNWNAKVLGVADEYLRLNNRSVARGRAYSEAELRGGVRVVLIGATVARELFADDDPLGQAVRLRGVLFEVIGILDAKGRAMGGEDQDDLMLAPLAAVAGTLATPATPGAVSYLMAQTRKGASGADASFDIADLLRERHRIQPGDPDDFHIDDMSSVIQAMTQITGAMTAVLGVIGGISLLVGGIGIMNIMLVSVAERTREIGIRRAIGARRRDVLLQFLFEAAVICLVGGAIGLALGGLGAVVAAQAMHLPPGLDGRVMLLAFGVSAAVGLFFGFYPAYKASRMRPVEALRAD